MPIHSREVNFTPTCVPRFGADWNPDGSYGRGVWGGRNLNITVSREEGQHIDLERK